MKKILFILLVVSVLMLGACSKKVVIDEKGNIIENTGVKVVEGDVKTETKNVVKGVKEDLASLLSSGTSSKCTFTDEEGSQITMWIKGDGYKIKTVNADGTSWGIKKGNFLYAWSEGLPAGFKFDTTKAGEESPVPTAEQLTKSSPDAQCEKVSLSDSDFALPTDIEFLDPSAFGG